LRFDVLKQTDKETGMFVVGHLDQAEADFAALLRRKEQLAGIPLIKRK